MGSNDFCLLKNKWKNLIIIISINQIDTCHTTNISKGGWFIQKTFKINKKNHIKWIYEEKINKNINIILT